MKIRSVKFNAVMNFIYTASAMVFPMVTFPYITRVLSVENNGKITFATSVITYLTMIASLGIPTYGIRACAKIRDDVQKLSKTVQELLLINIFTTVISYAAFLVLLFTVPRFMENKVLLAIMSINMLLNVIGVNWLYSALEQYTYITVRSLIFKILSIVLMFLLVKESQDYIIYGAITVFATSASNILNFINIRKFVSLKRSPDKYEFRKHIKPIMIFFATAAASSIYTTFDTILLGFIQNDLEVGYYTVPLKIKAVLTTFVMSLGTVLLPRLSYYVQKKNMDEFRKTIFMTLNFIMVFASAVSVYFMIFARESVTFISTDAFEESTLPMILMMPSVLFAGLANITGVQILTPMGQERKIMVAMICGAVIDIILNVVLCPFFGAVGTALASSAAELTVLLVECWYLRDRIKAHLRDVSIFKTAASLFVAAVCGILLKIFLSLTPFAMLCCSAVLFFGVYVAMLLLLKEPFVCGVVKNTLAKIRNRK